MNNKRIVVKVGTSTLCHGGNGMNFRNIEKLARTLSDIRNGGREVVLVSSGAIGAGTSRMQMKKRPEEIRAKQAIAAIGQCELMHIYDKLFGEYGVPVGQILLSKDDVEHPTVRDNLTGTFEALLEMGAIPVVNENDSVCIEEIESEHKVFGDNDTLSAMVARLIHADLLVILTDIDGMYDANPLQNMDAKLLFKVNPFDERLDAMVGGAGSEFGTGGMATKLAAARLAAQAGIDTVVTNGAVPENLYTIIEHGGVGTLFTVKG
jgi:glutamate 5-kinase